MFPSALIVLPSALPLNVIDLYCSTFDSVNSKSVPFFCSNIHVVPFSHGPDTSFNVLMFLSHFSHLQKAVTFKKSDVEMLLQKMSISYVPIFNLTSYQLNKSPRLSEVMPRRLPRFCNMTLRRYYELYLLDF